MVAMTRRLDPNWSGLQHWLLTTGSPVESNGRLTYGIVSGDPVSRRRSCRPRAQRVVSTTLPATARLDHRSVAPSARSKVAPTSGRRPSSTSSASLSAVSANSPGSTSSSSRQAAPTTSRVAQQEPVGRGGGDRAGGEPDGDQPPLRAQAPHALLEHRAADRVDDQVDAARGAHRVEPALVVVHGARAGPGGQLATLGAARDRQHLVAERGRDLHHRAAQPAAGAVHEHAVAPLQPAAPGRARRSRCGG